MQSRAAAKRSTGSTGRVRGIGTVVAVLALAAGTVGCGAKGGGEPEAEPASEPVALEAVGETGSDPFTDSVAITEVVAFPDSVSATISATFAGFDTTDDAESGGPVVTGDTPGLYGGSNEEAACDVEQLAAFLADPANADKADAFGATLGVPSGDLGDWLAGLTPVVLTTDTLVTNHGFRDGRATPFPAVLQAGTAVLVDDTGTPVVKCNCGNPLTPPEDDADLSSTSGDAWEGFDPATTTTVTPASDPVTELTLVDTTTGSTFTRQPGASTAAPLDPNNMLLPGNACQVAMPEEDGRPPLHLVEGQGFRGNPGEVDYLSMWVDGGHLDLDVDEDGTGEIVVVATCNGGGTGFFPNLVALRAGTDADGVAQLVGPAEGIDARHVTSLTLDGDVAVVEAVTWGPDEPMCCPTVEVTYRYRWVDGGWVQQ